MSIRRNIFAHTDPVCTYPAFLSINEEPEGAVSIIVRSPPKDGAEGTQAKIVLTVAQANSLTDALIDQRLWRRGRVPMTEIDKLAANLRKATEADWSNLPTHLYVTSARKADASGVVWDATMCSVPMAIVPEVLYVRADILAPERPTNYPAATLLHPWPGEIMPGTRVEKFTGEARWFGRVAACYRTCRGAVRYVVEVEPQGFQMICTPEQIRTVAEGCVYGVHLDVDSCQALKDRYPVNTPEEAIISSMAEGLSS